MIFLHLLLIVFEVANVLTIYGGDNVDHYPFFVTVEANRVFCGGTIIAPDSVLTAARCLYNSNKKRFVWLTFLVGAFTKKSALLLQGVFFQFTLNGPLFFFICSNILKVFKVRI